MTQPIEESFEALKNRLNEIQTKMEAARKRELEPILISIRKMVIEYGITERDIFGRCKLDRAHNSKLDRGTVKYQNPETGETWTGRGRPPRWIAGKRYDRFLIRTRA